MSEAQQHAELLRLCERFGIDRRHSLHVARISDVLYWQCRHLHGLTKTSYRLVQTAAMLHDIGGDGPAHHLRGKNKIARLTGLGLTATQRRIVAEAVALHARQADLPAFTFRLAGSPEAATLGVAARIGAILRIADGLDRGRAQDTEITAIVDDGRAIEVYVRGGPQAGDNAYAALAKADLWQMVALRPIRSIALHTGEPPPAGWIRPGDTVADAARKILQRHLEHLICREYGLGYAADIEYVHEMRVATRRMRAAMRTFQKAVKGAFSDSRSKIQLLADALGLARDCDVFEKFLDACICGADGAHLPFLRSLMRSEKRRRRTHYRQLLQTWASPAYTKLTRGLYRAVCLPAGVRGGLQPVGKRARRPLWNQARRALRAGLRRLEPFGRRIDRLSPARQHDLRIECKRMRYTAESFADVYPQPLEKLVAAMVRMQDLLGEVHDADVYGDRLRRYFQRRSARVSDPGAAAAVKVILDRLGARQQELLGKARRAWMSFTAQKTRKQVAEWIDSPLKP